MKWTDKQQKVIDTRDRNILVSAAAGSGKTAVLVERIIKMITDEENPTDVNQLLVVTFTRAAASEMKERIREALEKMEEDNPNDLNVQKQLSLIHNANISTIDSFCARVVKDNFDKIDLDPNFRIADENEIEMLQSDIVEEMLEEYYLAADDEFMELAEKYSTGKTSDSIGELILRMYKFASGQIEPEKWIKEAISVYDVSSKEEMEQSKWMQGYLELQKNRLEGILSQLNIALTISESEDGPKCAKALTPIIDKLQEITESRTYSAMQSELQNIPSTRVSGKKDCNERKKEQVKAIKNDATKAIKDLTTKQFNLTLNQVFESICETKSSVEYIGKLTLEFMKRLKEQKEEKGIMDFNDQAFFALHILNEYDKDGNLVPSETAKNMATQFKEIMIDEYQDSNIIQEAILSAITKGFGINNMFMVGDVKQSIYRFRNAEPKLFLEKYNSFSDDPSADSVKIVLDKNFRSRREVIESVNFLFDFVMHEEVGGIDYKNGNGLVLGADYDEPPAGQDNSTEFVMVEGGDKSDEAAYVARKIKEITNPETGLKITEKGKDMRPVRYGDIVILLRSMKDNSDIYREQLENNGIPVFAESKTGYYKTMEVMTITNMLSIIDNPRQDIPLAAVLTSPMFGFDSNQLAIIKTENVCESFYDCVEQYSLSGSDVELRTRLTEFLNTLTKFRNMVPFTTVYDLINTLLDETGYVFYIRSMPGGKKRLLNIQALKEKAVAYDETSYKGLFNFLRYIEKIQYLAKDDGEASTVNENDNIVRIMSIHKSKGLQFPVVFLCNTNGTSKNEANQLVSGADGNIGIDCINNKLKTKQTPLLKTYIRMSNKEEDVAETLRILYVALTRAKEKLYITGLVKNAEKQIGEFESQIYDNSELMLYNDVIGAKTIMELIGKTIGRNKAFDCVRTDKDATECGNPLYDKDSFIKVKVEEQPDVILGLAAEDITDSIKKETMLMEMKQLANKENTSIEKLFQRFQFQYPYIEDITLHSKASVTEIKKQSQGMEQEEEQDAFQAFGEEVELPEIIPDFEKEDIDEPQYLTGAMRGTAYHRIFELLDMELEEYNQETVKKMIDGFVDAGLIDRMGAASVMRKDIIDFTKSDLFRRMKKAYANNQLYREQHFLMGVPACEINSNTTSKETMIIQGIIDLCFVENDKYVIVDYKTDKVDTMEELVERYHVQLECYKLAIEQILGSEPGVNKVSEMIIYSVHLGQQITIK